MPMGHICFMTILNFSPILFETVGETAFGATKERNATIRGSNPCSLNWNYDALPIALYELIIMLF